MSSTVLTNDTGVLIIDDDKSILQILSKILEKKGFRVDTAQGGQEAITKLSAKTYSAALIDVRLQDTNGLDLLIKIQEIAPKMRKILLTGYPSDEDRIKALERGADYYLAKPVDSEKLIEIISTKAGKDRTNNF
jgi:two-component system response regulator RegA